MLSLIVALDENNLIGSENSMPWDVPEDLSLFKEITTNNIVIMGRKTFQSIGKPLPNRVNFVLTKDENFFCEGIQVFNCPNKALKKAYILQKKTNKKIFIIGGKTIYEYFLPYITEFHFSYIKGKYSGNVFFPKINLSNFQIINQKEFKDFTYIHYLKNTCNF